MNKTTDVVEFRQGKNAIMISYAVYRWMLAAMTAGIVVVLDFLNYKNTKLCFEPKFLVYVSGALTTNSKEIPYEDIKTVRTEQSIIGKFFNYGSVRILMKETQDTIVFKYVNDPESVRKAVQEKYVTSDKLKLL